MIGRRRAERAGPRRDRRRTQRRAAGWESRYVVADRADELWFLAASNDAPCLVRDLSMAGACLELEDGDVAVGSRMVLDLQLGDRRGPSIRLAAAVRYAMKDDDGRVRAGVEFDEVGDLERALLFRLLRDLESVGRDAG
jgi:hypothetical protein